MKKLLPVALALFALVPSAFAQDYPSRIITLVSPFPPGGPSDTTARIQEMHITLGQMLCGALEIELGLTP